MGPGRAQVLPAFSLSLGGNTPSWGGVNRLPVRSRPGGAGLPKTPKRGEPGGASPGLIRDARPLLQGHLGGCAIQRELNKQQLYDKIHGHVSRVISGLYGDGHEEAVLDHREELCITVATGEVEPGPRAASQHRGARLTGMWKRNTPSL